LKRALLVGRRGPLGVVGLLAAIGAAVAIPMAGQAATGSTKASASAKVTVITVTAGKPSEFAFKLSKFSNVPTGVITFKVTNQGKIGHTFEICTKSNLTGIYPNSCKGKVTKLLQHGQSQVITVTLPRSGIYEFLCTFPGHAAGGMKGILGVGMKVTAAQQKASTKPPANTGTTTTSSGGTTTSVATTTAAGTTTSSGGGGGLVNDGCPSGFTIQTYGATDNDLDETGAAASDGDGCV
jgi:uncharacterized cupredoxin-like copper-binding protein